MISNNLVAIFLTLKLAMVSTLILLLIATPLAWWLSTPYFQHTAYDKHNHRSQRWKLKAVIESLATLPLVMPPTVLGFYLLLILNPNHFPGQILKSIGISAFSFSGLVMGSVIYSLPFVVQPLKNNFSMIEKKHGEVAATLGAGPINRFFTITLPLARPGYLTAAILGFAHTMGEFGVVLMIGGNISGETRVISIAIYDYVEALDYTQAHWLSATLLLLSFGLLFSIYFIRRNFQNTFNLS